jgi:hypothetical protein
MLYLYDRAICKDLEQSFTDDMGTSAVKVVSPEQTSAVIAQIKEDKVQLPMISLIRDSDIPIDKTRLNLARAHNGISAVFDKENNIYYNEKILPIELSYEMTLFADNQADIDELVRELQFKYLDMYFLTIKLPYEADRKMRFGVVVDMDYGIKQERYSSTYLQDGLMYQAKIRLKCQGCNLITYTPLKLKNVQTEIVPTDK